MPTLSWNGARFNLRCSPAEKETAKAAGFHWDYQAGQWWTGLISVAKLYEAYADNTAKQRFAKETQQIQLSQALDSNINIPAPEGKTYLGFQKAGIEFALRRRNTLNADEMGLGKTIQALGVINAEPKIKKVLIIPPASLKINWQKELMAWLVRSMSGGFVNGADFPDTEIVICNYEGIKRNRKKIDDVMWDLLICDEAHYLKNPDSQRTRSVMGADSYGKDTIAPIDAGMRMFLTGTPILSRPVELWPILRVADPEGLGASHWNFVKKFCLPPEAPILMSDLSEKQIVDIKVGDIVIGWKREKFQRRLCESKVLDIIVKDSPLQRVDFDDGTYVLCTPDHKWLSERRDVSEYTVAKVGKFLGRGSGKASRLVRIIDSGMKPKFLHENDYKHGYLIGFFRGDGWCSQTRKKRENPFKNLTTYGIRGHAIGAACNDKEPIDRCHEYLNYYKIEHSSPYQREDMLWQIDCNHEQAYKFFTEVYPSSNAWWAGFLGGIYDAEGSHCNLAQSQSINLPTWSLIKQALERFNIKFSINKDGFNLLCTRDEWLKFWFLCSPSLSRKMRSYLFGVPSRTGFGEETKIVESFKGSGGKFMKRVIRPIKITPLEHTGKVYTLTTETGNYVAYGVGSKNCKAWEAPWGWDFSGHDHLEELQDRLRASIMIRRLKKYVLTELPPKRRQVIAIPGEKAKAAIQSELAFYAKNQKIVEVARAQAEIEQFRGDDTSYKLAVEGLIPATKALFEEMSKLRHATAIAKIPYVIEYLQDDILQQEDKVVVFTYHREVVDKIYEQFKDQAVYMHGGMTNMADRQASVDKFMADPNCHMIIGSIGTMGVGWTLTAATYCLFVELDWVPSNVTQAEDRLHRIGQTGSVLIHHLVFDQSLDARMAQVIVEKQEVIDAALG